VGLCCDSLASFVGEFLPILDLGQLQIAVNKSLDENYCALVGNEYSQMQIRGGSGVRGSNSSVPA
jgi:hypothetical protein